MSDIKNQIVKILDDFDTFDRLSTFDDTVAKILALYPHWQSFSEAKPEEGWAILVREYPYEPFVKRYNPAELEARILYKHQWLRIPDSEVPIKDRQWAVVEINESVTFQHKELAIEYRDACAKKFPDKHFSVIQIQ